MSGAGNRIVLIFGLFVLGVLLYSAYWHYLARSAPKLVHEYTEAWRRQNIEANFSQVNVSGYPYRLEVSLDDIEARFATNLNHVALAMPNVKLTAHPWNLKHWVGVSRAPSHTMIGLGERALGVEVGRSRASLVLGEQMRTERFSLEMNDVVLQSVSGQASGALDQLQVHLRNPPLAALSQEIGVLADNVRVRNIGTAQQSFDIDGLVMEAKLSGPALVGWDVASLNRWRAGGGILEIQNLQVSAGGLGVVFSGTIALDALFRPIGAGTVVIDGYRELLETFYSSGLINNLAKAAAILTLDLLSTMSEETGQRSVEAPISVQDGVLSVGPVALMEVSPFIAP